MPSTTRISSLDFKPRQRKSRWTLPVRWHWIILGICAFIALVLLLSAKDKADATLERLSLQRLSDSTQTLAGAKIDYTLELPIPRQQEITADKGGQTSPSLAVDPAAQNLVPAGISDLLATVPQAASKADEPESKRQKTTLSTADQTKWEMITVKPGDSLTAIFKRQGLSSQAVFAVTHADGAPKSVQALRQLYPGDKIWLRISDDGTLLAVRRKLNEATMLTLRREGTTGTAFHATLTKHHLERRIAHASAVIHESLYQAAAKVGMSNELIMELADIFDWKIDFAHDIRNGDSFAVIYSQYYKGDEKIRAGHIIAAEFINQGKRYRAIRYTAPSGQTGYYTPDGESMRQALLRTPVEFLYISSPFNKNRCHPILDVCRPHEGTDFAAPIGTPIHAAGDGVVAFAGHQGGYGNTVVIKHGHGYSTLYGHMQRIHKGIHAGVHVTQGQIIGYVGQSGLATGPHLHYEIRINGVPKNPMTVALPEAKPIANRYMADFKAKASSWLARLTMITRTHLARNAHSN